MTALQKVNLGTAPAGVDGDAVRTAFIKDNANVDVLNSQTFLTSATLITSAQALTTAHIGKRVNINLGSPGTINLPAASTCAADQVTLLRNLGTTVVTLAITTGSGDTVSVSKINPGETALMDTDGVHAWTCLMRGRTNSDNETVNGNCAVNGNETVAGTLGVAGATTLGVRPTFAGNTPWDSGNLVGPATLAGTQTFTGAKTFSSRPTWAGATPYDTVNLNPVAVQVGHTMALSWSAFSTVSLNVDGTFIGSLVVGGGNQHRVTWTGTALSYAVDGTTVGTLAFTSDYRVKQVVSRISGSLDRVMQLQPTTYKFKSVGIFQESDRENSGFIAHEVQAVIPSAVEGVKDAVDAEGNPQFQSLNPLPLIAELTAALQESYTALLALKDRVSVLESTSA